MQNTEGPGIHMDSYALAYGIWQIYNRRNPIYEEDIQDIEVLWSLIDNGHVVKASEEDEDFDDVCDEEDLEEQSYEDVVQDSYYGGLSRTYGC
jgi:hypothetical protein